LSTFTVKGLSIKRGGLTLVDKLSFSIEGPFFLALVGDNGCGKTSFLKAILNQVPFEGEISFFSSGIGYIAQKSQLQFGMKVKDLVVMGAYAGKGLFDNYSEKDYRKAKKILQKLNLDQKYNSSYLDLSGGEQQLVWLAQQLMLSPKVLLLDEPTANLDVKNKTLFFFYINELVAEGTQVICVTHDLFFLKEMNGYFLNISDNNPAMKTISPLSIESLYLDMSN
jgi:iron complex transport system ATP-binding protein